MPAPTTVRSVRSRVAESVGRLRAVGDPERAQGQRRYFKVYERVRFFGVAAPDVRRIGREVFGEVRKSWTVDDAVAYCDALVRRAELEAKVLGLFVLARFERSFRKQLLGTVKQWLLRDFLATWAAVDAVSPWVIAPLIGRYPDLGYAVKGWTRSRSLWVRRAALVSFIPLARRGERLDDAYDTAEALFGDSHDLIHKATGWLLREAGKTNMARLERLLRRHGPRIPRTTIRTAIERFPERKRRSLLEVTK